MSQLVGDARAQTLASFDWQWAHLASGDFMPGDPWFDANATRVLAHELCAIDASWFVGKRVLDAGCGQGRWTRALLDLGAHVTAIDFSEAGLGRTLDVCRRHPNLRAQRVDLLDIPADLARERFDLVFSFGVLHHTGDTWRALSNIAGLVDDAGALFLYLYGATSWGAADESEVMQVRGELAAVSFEEKIEVLKRRFPGQDPHQLFDLLSPTINDRVLLDEVRDRLGSLGFRDTVQTVASGEIFARAIRPGFPSAALRAAAGKQSTYAEESASRWQRRMGAGFELTLREHLASVCQRETPEPVRDEISSLLLGETILDVSLPPDRLALRGSDTRRLAFWEEGSPASPGAALSGRAPVIVALGASLGACRFPSEYLSSLWNAVPRGGALVVELPASASIAPHRSLLTRVLDARKPVPDKVSSMLKRRARWCTGQALEAVGGKLLLNPILPDEAERMLGSLGATTRLISPARAGTALLVARRA